MSLGIGLGLADRKPPALGPELVQNHNFAASDGWSLIETATISGGQLTLGDKTGTEPSAAQDIGMVTGRTYRVVLTIASSAYTGTLYTPGSSTGLPSTKVWDKVAGEQTHEFVADSTDIRISHGGSGTRTGDTVIDSLSVREVRNP